MHFVRYFLEAMHHGDRRFRQTTLNFQFALSHLVVIMAANGLPLPNTTHHEHQTLMQRILRGPSEQQAKARLPRDNARIKKLILSYGFDWIVTIILFAVFVVLADRGGYKRQFSLTDTSLQHTYAVKERVPFWAAILIGGAAPVVIIALVGGVWRRSIYDVHSGWLGLLLSLALTTSATEIIKVSLVSFMSRLDIATVSKARFTLMRVFSEYCRSSASRYNRQVSADARRSKRSAVWARHFRHLHANI